MFNRAIIACFLSLWLSAFCRAEIQTLHVEPGKLVVLQPSSDDGAAWLPLDPIDLDFRLTTEGELVFAAWPDGAAIIVVRIFADIGPDEKVRIQPPERWIVKVGGSGPVVPPPQDDLTGAAKQARDEYAKLPDQARAYLSRAAAKIEDAIASASADWSGKMLLDKSSEGVRDVYDVNLALATLYMEQVKPTFARLLRANRAVDKLEDVAAMAELLNELAIGMRAAS